MSAVRAARGGQSNGIPPEMAGTVAHMSRARHSAPSIIMTLDQYARDNPGVCEVCDDAHLVDLLKAQESAR